MRARFLLVLPILVAGCDQRGDPGRNKTVHIAMDGQDSRDRLSVTIPGVDARLALPGLDLSRHVDLDGIKLAPRTDVTSIDVAGHGDAVGGRVLVAFTSPQPPAELLAYYRRSVEHAGYGGFSATETRLDATKGVKGFTLSLSPNGAGSRGTIVMSDG